MALTVDYCPTVRFSKGLSMNRPSMGSRTLWTVVCVITVFLRAGITGAMQVTSSGPQTIQKALDEKVNLGCTFISGASDTGELDIEWTMVSPDMTQKDMPILSYTGQKKYLHGPPSLMKRLDFITGDPSLGDASISISGLLVSDTGTYQCKVKKAPGVDMRKVTLVVMVPPSVPKCWVEGGEEIGGPVSLRCKSSQGSIPISYTWKRESGGAIPPVATQNPLTGELLFTNHSESYKGNYLCEVKNAVGQQSCRYTLQAVQPTNKTAVIVGAVIGALLLLLLLLLLIWLLVCLCHKRRYQKEVANEIREDAPAPESRPGSRNSSFRSVMGYRAHPGIYSSVRNAKWIGSERGSVQSNRSRTAPPTSSQAAPLKYDSRYGYPV
ncbi:V-set and immunoglobulin domain-containing protein 8b isoform X1 [Anguilla anguilla]|uniref:V-set and immunoglobulin domain-containing protein 8b isoform X1 n=2 Tax=Anguilla anguilla TaxID=7936 RepID=UPI0015AD7D06|nr:V-set and immunoglobulin domain-containing protein 8b isoform X1 [Anguilla anguilla]